MLPVLIAPGGDRRKTDTKTRTLHNLGAESYLVRFYSVGTIDLGDQTHPKRIPVGAKRRELSEEVTTSVYFNVGNKLIKMSLVCRISLRSVPF